MNQVSSVPFGPDATVLAGYAHSTGPAGQPLGNIDFVFENRGNNTAFIKLAQYDGTTGTTLTSAGISGYRDVGTAFSLVAGGTTTRSFVLVNQRIGFFGSGNTMVNISTVIRNKGDLRGAQIDIVTVARRNWGYDAAFSRPNLTKKWGGVGGVSTSGNIDAGTGPFTGGEGV